MTNKEYHRLWRENNPDKVREYKERYRESNKIKSKTWREANYEYHREQIKVWQKNNVEKCRFYVKSRKLKMKGTKIPNTHIMKKDICNWESRICGICNQYIEGDFHLDHIVPLSRGGLHRVDNLQLAHPVCNQSKFNKLTSELVEYKIKSSKPTVAG